MAVGIVDCRVVNCWRRLMFTYNAVYSLLFFFFVLIFLFYSQSSVCISTSSDSEAV